MAGNERGKDAREERDGFLDELAALRARLERGDPEAPAALEALAGSLVEAEERAGGPDRDADRWRLVSELIARHGGRIAERQRCEPEDEAGRPLLAAPGGAPPGGVSLVTCCMNRNANLLRALPSWLVLDAVSEIVIVDWSSGVPVADELARAGFDDPRIRVARVEGERRWILSHAFNIGFRLARFDKVLKVDADIVLDPAFFDRNPLAPGTLVAGNWRSAGEGQSFVNGFFYTHRADLMAVNGFNEYITTYGWDDDDLYDRIQAAGTRRIDVAPGTVHHLDHDDAARLDPAEAAQGTGWSDLGRLPLYKIRTNRLLATMLPHWDTHRVMAPYRITGDAAAGPVLERAGPPVHSAPGHVRRTAERMAAYELVSWRAGLRTFDLDPPAFEALLEARRLEEITALHVELMLSGAGLSAAATPRHLVIELDESALAMGVGALAPAARTLSQTARRSGRLAVLRLPRPTRPPGLPPELAALPCLAAWHGIGPVRDIAADAVADDPATPILRVALSAGDLAAFGHAALPAPAPDPAERFARETPAAGPALPATARGRGARLFIDAQHGLGNRLRAIGSAAAVARATDRELVVVWQPDHHCEGRMADLFDYAGPVIEESCLAAARAEGATVLNYMEIEEGAAKGAPLELAAGRDAYIRSAYVIAHPASRWESENVFLRGLAPCAEVRALLEGQPATPAIGLHVRMEGAPGRDGQSYDSAENWSPEGHAEIHRWRSESHFDRFIARLGALFEADPGAEAFLAADLPETYEAFEARFGDRVHRLRRDLYDRSAAQLRHALADILMLARTRHFLGSNWSSFSEAALRLSATIETREYAGVDF